MTFALEAPAELRRELRMVVEALLDIDDAIAGSLMLVGAQCRDVLHRSYGHRSSLRSTTDYDLGLAVASGAAFNEISAQLEPLGGSPCRYLISGLPVDVMPFGEIEAPPGRVTVAQPAIDDRGVQGFSQVFDHALVLDIGAEHGLRVPDSIGYIALKAVAAVERAARHEYRDFPDLVTAVMWHANDDEWLTAGYSDVHADAFESMDYDIAATIGFLTAMRVGALLSPAHRSFLATGWGSSMRDRLVSATASYGQASRQTLSSAVAGLAHGFASLDS